MHYQSLILHDGSTASVASGTSPYAPWHRTGRKSSSPSIPRIRGQRTSGPVRSSTAASDRAKEWLSGRCPSTRMTS